MQERQKDLGDFYKTALEDLDLRGDQSEWSAIELKLEKEKFFRFSWSRFNIYHTLFIGLTFIFSAASFIHLFFLQKNKTIEKTEAQTNIRPIDQKKTSQDSLKSVIIENEKKSRNEVYLNELSKDSFSKEKKIITDKNSVVKETGTEKPEKNGIEKQELKEDSSNIPLKQIKINPVPPPVYITKQDTVIVIDSVKTKTKKIKRR